MCASTNEHCSQVHADYEQEISMEKKQWTKPEITVIPPKRAEEIYEKYRALGILQHSRADGNIQLQPGVTEKQFIAVLIQALREYNELNRSIKP